jgi:hypothetical protein
MDDFKLLLGTNESRLSPDNAERLSNACLVVNALGPKVGWVGQKSRCGATRASPAKTHISAPRHQRHGAMALKARLWPLLTGLFPPPPRTKTTTQVRDGLMDWLCDREMTVYQTIFSMSGGLRGAGSPAAGECVEWNRLLRERPTPPRPIHPTKTANCPFQHPPGDAAKLDRFDRRFVWFKSRLDERREVWGLFPASWRVPQTLCLTFCKITKVRSCCGLGRRLGRPQCIASSILTPPKT